MRLFFQSMAACASLIASPALADSRPVVVELYTSQGCSSCPPADEMLTQLAQRDDVIALALHVDYWDYIGWKDEFANPAYTQRQHAYAAAVGAKSVYTPQMVIGGLDHVIGSRPMEVSDIIQRHRAIDHGVVLDVSRSGDTLSIAAENSNEPVAMVVQIVRITPEQTVAIERGENAGHEMVYSNIVNSWQVAGEWDGAAPLAMQATVMGDDPVVVLIQNGTDGPILAAAQLN